MNWFNNMMTMKEADGFFIKDPYLIHVIPLGTVFLYFIMVKTLPKILQQFYDPPPPRPKKGEKRPKKELSLLEWIIFFHNMFNSAISAYGVFYGGYFYLQYILEMGFGNSFCDPEGLIPNSETPLNSLCVVYVWCKYLELLDTVFLIIKNPYREVYFLHWYHHITVLLFAWYSFHIQTSISYLFGIVNFLIHMFMYYYYAIAVISKPPKWGKYMMIAQMAQMFFALGVFSYYNYLFFGTEGSCHMNAEMIPFIPKKAMKIGWFVYCYIMYSSYLYLFAVMFIKRFIRGKSYKKIQTKKE